MEDPVLSRRSIRKYTDEPVNDDVVERLLRAAMAAPSAGNQQPWEFIVIRDRDVLAAIPGVHPYSSMVPKEQLAILICGDRGKERSPPYWEQACSAAPENLLLAPGQLGAGETGCAPRVREPPGRPRGRGEQCPDLNGSPLSTTAKCVTASLCRSIPRVSAV